jgi:K+-transporting ATPase ATPase C chain
MKSISFPDTRPQDVATTASEAPPKTGRGATLGIELRRGFLFTLVTMGLLGIVYPLVLWAVGRGLFPAQAEGSLLRRGDGSVLGSSLIAQKFSRREYFAPRPSGVDYNAASTGGTNYGPSNPDHLKAVRERLEAIEVREGVKAGEVPSEMVTASGGGLDPHISPEAAELQATRVARARGVPVERVRALIRGHTEAPTLGFLGRARVNVLMLNLALDASLPVPVATAPGR